MRNSTAQNQSKVSAPTIGWFEKFSAATSIGLGRVGSAVTHTPDYIQVGKQRADAAHAAHIAELLAQLK